MERITTRRTATKKSLVLALALTLAIAVASYTIPGFPFVEDDQPASASVASEKTIGSPPGVPKDKTLKLTVPEMDRVQDLPVRDGTATDEDALGESALHVRDTGFPWQENANVYIAGHRIGYLGSDSFLVFYDLDKLENGDEVFLTDAEGTRYSYRVFDKFVADPYDWGPTEPIPGKSVVTLQTCTLPDYTQRLIVQAELVEVIPGAGSPQEKEETVQQQQEEAVPQEVVPQDQAVLLQEDAVPQEVVPLQEEAMPQEAL